MKLFRAPRLFRLILIAALLFVVARRLHAGEAEDMRAAMALMRTGDWHAALDVAGPVGSIPRDIIEWHRLRGSAGGASFSDYRGFLARRPDWPGLPYLRRFGEATISEGEDAKLVAGYFNAEPPQTGDGILQAVRAYMALGQTGDAEALAVLAWRSMTLGEPAESRLQAQFPQLLAKHDVARLDMLLWAGEADAARRLMPRVPEGWQKLAEARLGLRASVDGVDALIAAVPADLADDAGLAWERYLWRKRKGRSDDAVELLRERSTSAKALGVPARWSGDRRNLARELMRQGKPKLAYEIASKHFLPQSDSDYPELEWLSGYIALRFLNDPAAAFEHFVRFQSVVSTPISLGRAGYWEGRALEAAGDKLNAQAAYEFGAEFQTSFYGLLAAEKAGLPMDPALLGQEKNPDWHNAAFLKSSVMQAALLLLKSGETDLAERFMRHLCESLDATGIAQMADMTLDMGEPHLALRIAKYAADQGITLNRPYYPLHPIYKDKLSVPTELALSIARRESEFDPVVISPAGARGLMQLMPGTAKDMATKLGVEYQLGKLTSDADYNAVLGTAYLAELIDTFGPNWMLVAAAYNAGPSRPLRWIEDYGDPRYGQIDPVDWIETIPFEETRNYVMRVTELIPVYRARLTGETGPITLSKDLVAR